MKLVPLQWRGLKLLRSRLVEVSNEFLFTDLCALNAVLYWERTHDGVPVQELAQPLCESALRLWIGQESLLRLGDGLGGE